MTLPFEKKNAVIRAREFLRDLLDPAKTKRIPLEIRKRAYTVLKHFPFDLDLERINKCKRCREIIGGD